MKFLDQFESPLISCPLHVLRLPRHEVTTTEGLEVLFELNRYIVIMLREVKKQTTHLLKGPAGEDYGNTDQCTSLECSIRTIQLLITENNQINH
jgi:hypothetical protein